MHVNHMGRDKPQPHSCDNEYFKGGKVGFKRISLKRNGTLNSLRIE